MSEAVQIIEQYRAQAVQSEARAKQLGNLLIGLMLTGNLTERKIKKSVLESTQEYKLSAKELKNDVKLQLEKVEANE